MKAPYLAKQLIMPKPDTLSLAFHQKLASRLSYSLMECQVMKSFGYPPMPKTMHQHLIRVASLVQVKLVKQIVVRMVA